MEPRIHWAPTKADPKDCTLDPWMVENSHLEKEMVLSKYWETKKEQRIHSVLKMVGSIPKVTNWAWN